MATVLVAPWPFCFVFLSGAVEPRPAYLQRKRLEKVLDAMLTGFERTGVAAATALAAGSITNRTRRARAQHERLRAVRAMVVETGWLGGIVCWHEGRVVWERESIRVAPGARELSLAQRRLNQIAYFPRTADRVLGNSRAWLDERRAALAVAKQLAPLAGPDLPALAIRARRGDAAATGRLLALLAAEALSANGLPDSPAAALATCGVAAEAPLATVAHNTAAPAAARALAALALGAVHAAGGEAGAAGTLPAAGGRSRQPAAASSGWIRRAYAFGRRYGLPVVPAEVPTPALVIALLEPETGSALALRYLRAARSARTFALDPAQVRRLLANGRSAEQVVALAEAAAVAEALAERVLRHSVTLPDPRNPEQRRARRREARKEPPWYHRRAEAQRAHEVRRQLLRGVRGALAAYVAGTGDAAAVHALGRFVHSMLELGDLTPEVARSIGATLEMGLDLPSALQSGYMELLAAQHARLWDRETLGQDAPPREFAAWIEQRRQQHVARALAILRACGDAEVVQSVVEQGLHIELGAPARPWREPELYRVAVDVARAVCLVEERGPAWVLRALLDACRDAATARTLLQPVVDACRAAAPALRAHFLTVVAEAVGPTHESVRRSLPRLASYLRRLIAFDKEDSEAGGHCLCEPLLAGALVLERAAPEQAEVWFAWLVDHLRDRGRGRLRSWQTVQAVRAGVPLAAVLADGQLGRFQAVVRALLDHEIANMDHGAPRWDEGVRALQRFPSLRRAVGTLFARQPHRCAALVTRIGLAAGLGGDVLVPLTSLAMDGGDPELASMPEWNDLLRLAPEVAGEAAAYVRAQRAGGGAVGLPAGVRQTLQQPRKLAEELRYLERRLAADAAADLGGRGPVMAARAAGLRARLAKHDELLAGVRQEAAERLAQVAAEAQLAAAECLVAGCFRARLAEVVGALPEGWAFDDDLSNATVLTAHIRENRKLLWRLLRAHMSGDRQWRERHPANAVFLRQLAARGVDVRAWLAAQPRVYACASAGGGRVRLYAEREPLRILQMGNYFGTCLSSDGVNAFSAVANACELNKRVLYATEGAEGPGSSARVVGRQLIAISAEGKLVGFRVYTGLADRRGDEALRKLFRRYVAAFAARCGLELADDGTVPTLFAESWYDDGIVPWAQELSARVSKGV